MRRRPISVIQFVNEIDSKKIGLFRGAVVASLREKNVLFHNHENGGLRYSYPLIQYKLIHRKAAVMGVGKGTEVISHLLAARDFNFKIGKERVEMQIEAVKAYDDEIVLTTKTACRYRLRNWLPLNSKNYGQYQASEGIVERIMLLENILIGNILSFLSGVDIRLEKQEQVKLHITDITSQHGLTYKNVKLMAFDIEFKTNISLPQYIGLGKSASVGCGILTRITN